MARIEKRVGPPRKDGSRATTWRAVWTPPGQKREASKSFKRKTDAQSHLDAVTAAKTSGTYVDPRRSQVTLAQWAETWRRGWGTLAPGSREAMRTHVDLHIVPSLGGFYLQNIKPSHISTWLAEDLSDLAPGYAHQVHGTLARMLDAAIEDGRLTRNPTTARSVRRPKATVTIRRSDLWTFEQISKARDALAPRYRALVDVMAGLGLRGGEAFGLSPDDLDRDGGFVEVRRQICLDGGKPYYAPPKYKKVRTVALPQVVLDALDAHMAEFSPVPVTLPWGGLDGEPTTVPLLFTSREKRFVNRNRWSVIWKAAAQAAGRPGSRADGGHALRHWYASALLDGGENIRAVASALGHADPGFTLRTYVHVMPESPARARAAIDAAFGAAFGATPTKSRPNDGDSGGNSLPASDFESY